MPGNCQTVLYRTTGPNSERRFHLSEDCERLGPQVDGISCDPLKAYPPVWREWCVVCGPRSGGRDS